MKTRSDDKNKVWHSDIPHHVWSFIIPGTGQDIIQNRLDVIEKAILWDSGNLKSEKTYKIRYQILKDAIDKRFSKLNSLRYHANEDAFTVFQELLALREIIKDEITDILKHSNNLNDDRKLSALLNILNQGLMEYISISDMYEISHDLEQEAISSDTDENKLNTFTNRLTSHDKQIIQTLKTQFIIKLHDLTTDDLMAYYKSIYEFNYEPPDEVKQYNIRVITLQGIGTEHINPMNMKDSSGKQKKHKTPFAKRYGEVTGAGEKQTIAYCMHELELAEMNGILPDRIILTGHSRGACTQIELAREIYIKYGNQIKIVMNLSDPVPGPGHFEESKRVIPPNVDSLILIYANNETNPVLKPLDINKLHFDPTTTTVSAIGYNGAHNDSLPTLTSVNNHLYLGFIYHEEDIDNMLIDNHDLFDHEHKHGKKFSGRHDCQFICMTDPNSNIHLSRQQTKFLHVLQSEFMQNDAESLNQLRSEINYHLAIQSHLPDNTPLRRKKILHSLYNVNLTPSKDELLLREMLKKPADHSAAEFEALAKRSIILCEDIINAYNENPHQFTGINDVMSFASNMTKIFENHAYHEDMQKDKFGFFDSRLEKSSKASEAPKKNTPSKRR